MTDKVTVAEIITLLKAMLESDGLMGRITDQQVEDSWVIITRLEQHGIAPPDGWWLAPNEPTAVMVEAYSRASEQLKKNHLLSGSYPAIWQPIEAGYKAMLAAAPKDNP